MEKVTIVSPTKELLKELSEHLSAGDVKLCLIHSRSTPLECLYEAFDKGEVVGIGMIGEKPVMTIMVRPCVWPWGSLLCKYGFISIVASDLAREYPKAFIQHSKRITDNLLSFFDGLVACTDSTDKRAMRYDAFLGFEDSGQEIIKDGKPFKYLLKTA